MNSLQVLVGQLQNLHQELTILERRKRIRKILKLVGIGFLLYRNVDEELSKVQNEIFTLIEKANFTAKEHLDHLRCKIDEVSKSRTYLQKSEEEEWLSLLGTFQSNIN